MKNQLELLYEEHAIITSAVNVIKQLGELIKKDIVLYESTVRKLIYFLREYADKFHHHKEENILFPEMLKKSELLQDGILSEMLDNHSDFREALIQVENYLEGKNYVKTQSTLEAYCEALLDHIAVENEEVFQMAGLLFSDEEMEKIRCRFADWDRDMSNDLKKELAEIKWILPS